MLKPIYALLALFVLVSCNSQNSLKGEDDYSHIDQLISTMTLEEKVGQMTQLSIDMISKGEPFALNVPHALDTSKLQQALIKYKVGSILNVGGYAYDLEHWRSIISTIQEVATSQTPNGIPILYGIDAIHGANYLLEGTLFPQPLAQAATFNPQLVKDAASITAYETRASGIPWNFSPVLDVARQPLWGRVFETYGEDVFLCTTLGSAAIEGYQSDDPSNPEHVSACMKHFLGYSMPFSGKDRTTVYLDERQLREIFLPSFEAAIDQGALSLMINSGDINGIPVHADKNILTGLLRDELGFDGVAVTDWEDIIKLQFPHKVAGSLKEAVKIAINAGVDMSMVPMDYDFCDILVELVKEGEVSMNRIDESVRRILIMKERLGLFDLPYNFDQHAYPLVGSDSFSKVAYDIAAESITLLKNNGTLPLETKKNVFVTGPTSNSLIMINGAWSRTWQGVDAQWDNPNKLTISEAIEEQFENCVWTKGCTTNEITELQEAKQKASSADVIIACMGEAPSTEKPADIPDLDIEDAQIDYIKELSSLNKPIILVLVENRPRVIREMEPYCDAIIMAYQFSDNGAKALADIISGKVNPSGKLPITYPRYSNDLHTYDHKHTDRLDVNFAYNAINPQWAFGHGLSYTSFNYSALELNKDSFAIEDTVSINVTVQNSGERDGKETILVYVTDEVASITPAVKRLRAFDKISIPAGKSVTVEFRIPISSLAFVGVENKWVVEEGEYTVEVGDQTVTFYLR